MKPEELKSFSERLKWVRSVYMLTLQDFGERIKISRSYLSKLENGKAVKPSRELIEKVCQFFDVREEWLEEGKGNPFSKPNFAQAIIDETGEQRELTPADEEYMDREKTFMAAKIVTRVTDSPEVLAKLLEQNLGFTPFNDGMRKLCKAVAEILVERIIKQRLTLEGRSATNVAVSNLQGSPKMKQLRDRIIAVTQKRGAKAELARAFGVSPQAVSEWLSGASSPEAETALRLLEWVAEEERKTQSSGSEATQPEPRTQEGESKYGHQEPPPNPEEH